MKSTRVMSYLSVLQLPVYWQRLGVSCADRIRMGGEGEELWRQVEELPLVSTYRDVVAVLFESHVEKYWGRFAVFICWLHRHETSYRYWRRLVQEHPDLVTQYVCDLASARPMGSLLSKLCSGPSNPILSLNDTCQRLRCLMACCGGNVNVITRDDAADVTDAGVQTDDDDDDDKTTQETEEQTEGDGCATQTTV